MSASDRLLALPAAMLCAAAMLLLPGCIKNNIPYPRIQASFTSLEVEDALQPPTIDSTALAVTLYLSERANPERVVVNGFSLWPLEAQWPDSAAWLNGIDLTEPRLATLTLYQDYAWSVTAVRDVERYFTVEQQVGASVIDVPGRRVIAYVPEGAPLTHLKVTSIKLEGVTATMAPNLDGREVDFTRPVEVTVTEFGRSEVWTLYVLTTEATVTTGSVDPWSCVAWLHGEAEEGKDNGFEYREASASTWLKVPRGMITTDGGSFTARLTGLTPETAYVARAYSGEEYGAEVEFTTQPTAQMPNSDFENWWLDGKVWCPWAEGGVSYWDTGNKGATTLGSSNTYPSDDTPTGTGRSACLETRFVGIGVLGKLAAGNIFAGSYVRTDGTNGILSFGRPFTVRPTHLTGWMKYHSADISSVTSGFEDLKGTPDTGIIWIALIDSDEPFEIRTNPKNRQLFDPEGSYVVAYGKMEWNTDVTEWTQFSIELNYKSTSRVPKYVLCTCSASSLGDYFTGGNGSILMIDDFSLTFDY